MIETSIKNVEELEQDLVNMQIYHMNLWNEYGSELCAGEMIKKEKELEDEIERRKNSGQE